MTPTPKALAAASEIYGFVFDKTPMDYTDANLAAIIEKHYRPRRVSRRNSRADKKHADFVKACGGF